MEEDGLSTRESAGRDEPQEKRALVPQSSQKAGSEGPPSAPCTVCTQRGKKRALALASWLLYGKRHGLC